MYLYKGQSGEFVAQTQYGEWQAKQAGFRWDAQKKVWWTTDQGKAEILAASVGMAYEVKQPAPPAQPQEAEQWPKISSARYALQDPESDVLKFYVVDKPNEGKWRGRLFLSVLASDTKYPIKEPKQKATILHRIAQNPTAAMCRYGQEVGCCSVCNRLLTDELSRAFGIGPVCRKGLNLEASMEAAKQVTGLANIPGLDYSQRGSNAGTSEEEE